MLPVILERLVERVEERTLLAVAQRLKLEPFGQRRRRRRLPELDRHLVEAPHLPIAAREVELSRCAVAERDLVEVPQTALLRPRLRAVDELRAEPETLRPRVHGADGDGDVAVRVRPADGERALLVLEQPRVSREIAVREPLLEV